MQRSASVHCLKVCCPLDKNMQSKRLVVIVSVYTTGSKTYLLLHYLLDRHEVVAVQLSTYKVTAKRLGAEHDGVTGEI